MGFKTTVLFMAQRAETGTTDLRGIRIIAVLMILFGIAEVVTGFTHNFIGILSTSQGSIPAITSAAVGGFYALGGLLLIGLKGRGIPKALVCLAIVIAGRIGLVITGIYPLTTFLQVFSIVIGTGLAVIFAAYLIRKTAPFREDY